MKSLTDLATRSFAGVRVGLDLANGSATAVAKEVFEALGATTYVINSAPDGLNINTNCGSTHIEGLQELVKKEKLDVGFAYDGDADRCLAVDGNGNLVEGDHIMYLCGKYMKEKGELANNTVVTTVMSNLGLYLAFDEIGIKYEKTAVGDKYVHENMMANGHCIGGENSGHIIFSKHATTGDGVLTSIKVMEVILETGKSLAELASGMTVYPQRLVNVKVTDKTEAQNDPGVQAKVAEVAEALGKEGRILVRESGTEPLLRVMVEAKTNELCVQYTDAVVATLQERGFVL
jgi:phosphoglucosamine mutase